LLTLDDLEAEPEQSLRAHLDVCPACQNYFLEMSAVAKNLSSLEPQSAVTPSATFHQKFVARLNQENDIPVWRSAVQWFQGFSLIPRIALPAVTAAIVIALFSMHYRERPESPLPPAQIATKSQPKRQLAPTIANYQMAAHQSLENLDDLISRQSSQNLTPAPIYTAASLSRAGVLE
jgi:hypothetical protein